MNAPLLNAIRTVSAVVLLVAFAVIHLGVILPVVWEDCPKVGMLNKNVEYVATSLNAFVLAVTAVLCGVKVASTNPPASGRRLRDIFRFETVPNEPGAMIRMSYVWTYLGCGLIALGTILFQPESPPLIANLGWGALAFVFAMSRAFFPELPPTGNSASGKNNDAASQRTD